MGDSDTSWRKYGIALLLSTAVVVISAFPDLGLPSPQDTSWTPLFGLLKAVIAGVGFSLVVFIPMMWSRESDADDRRARLRKAIYLFLIVGGGYYILEFSTRAFSYGNLTHTRLQLILAKIVEAGRGWLVALLLLALYASLIFLKFRRRR